MESVDVLGDEQELIEAPAPGRQNIVRAIGETPGHLLSPPGVPLPDKVRIASKGGRRGEFLWSPLAPEAVRATKSWDSAWCGDPGPGEDYKPPGIGKAPSQLPQRGLRCHTKS